MSKRLAQRKFILPAGTILIGAAMVWFDLLGGEAWAAMASALVTGFYAVTGWATNKETLNVD